MILVLAGNYRQYLKWLKQNNVSKNEARYVYQPEQCMGLVDCEFVMAGEYYKNPLYKDSAFQVYALTHGFKHIPDSAC